ncbi:putative holin-like toxin [Lacticaseibacillus sp. N501-2]|uniref:putative holin-like toxin n=1 Tax=Lacticaseibacillus salsurae TaxID=3367729 RepID=UPI0038B2B5B8
MSVADALMLMLAFGGFVLTFVGVVIVRFKQSSAIKKTVNKLLCREFDSLYSLNQCQPSLTVCGVV